MKTQKELKKALKKEKVVAMLAPSFIAEFDYPYIARELRRLGFDKVTELTFGAKLVNHEYHEMIKSSKTLLIASVCPGIVESIKKEFPQYEKNLIQVVSPMIATANVCKKIYPKHKTCFITPCNFKKIEAERSGCVDFVITYPELWQMIQSCSVKNHKKGKEHFDKFYNDYTKIYPLAGGLSKTAHLKGILKPGEEKKIDGWPEVARFLKNPDKKIRFLDVTFCKGACIGGPFVSDKYNLHERMARVLDYFERAKHETIPKIDEGILKKARGINLSAKY